MTTTPNPEFEGQAPQEPQSASPTPESSTQTPPPPPPAPEAPVYPQPADQQGYQQPAYQQPDYQQPAYPQPGQATTAYGQQVLDPAQQRQWGMLSHLIGLAAMVFSAGIAGFVGSLIVYLLYKERGDFVRRHAANSLNVQITMAIATVVGIILCLTIIGLVVGIPLLIAAWIWAFVVHIVGAMKANNGELSDPPMASSFVKCAPRAHSASPRVVIAPHPARDPPARRDVLSRRRVGRAEQVRRRP